MATHLELGLDTFGDITAGPAGQLLPHAQVIRDVIDEAILADTLGVDFFGVGEHHRANAEEIDTERVGQDRFVDDVADDLRMRQELAAARSPTVLVVGGDMPALSVALLEAMVALLLASDESAVVLEHDGRGRPLPMAVRRVPALTTASALFAGGERRLRALAEALSAAVLPEAAWRPIDPDGDTLRDIDTEADLG